jgi:hypothetical protein
MTHKLVFTAPMELGRFASSVITPRGYTAGGGSCATYIFPHNLPLSPRFLPYGSKRKIEREIDLENRREILSLRGFIYPSLLIHGGVGLVRVGVTQEHPQNPVSRGYMIATELATCPMPEDPTSLTPVGGYVMACATFYKIGFGVPSHQFLRFLLHFYDL